MMFALALLAPIFQEPANAQVVSAGPLVSKMLARYLTTEEQSVRLTTIQSAKGLSLTTVTDLQWKVPGQLYLAQRRDGARPRASLTVADGTRFAFDRPEDSLGPKRFVELISQNGIVQTLPDLYIATKESLVERSGVLDIMMGSRADVRALRALWSPLDLDGPREVKGRQTTKIKGQFRLTPEGPYAGDLEMYVTESGELVRYALRQVVAPPPEAAAGGPITVTTVTDIESTVADPSKYRVEG